MIHYNERLPRIPEPTIGQLCARILGIPECDLSESDAWEYIGGACVTGAYCPLSRREVENVWDRFIVPGSEGMAR